MKLASSDARNRAGPATSSGVPSRPSGISPRAGSYFCTNSGSFRTGWVKRVLMKPGPRALDRMPCLPNSRARVLAKRYSPAFEAL